MLWVELTVYAALNVRQFSWSGSSAILFLTMTRLPCMKYYSDCAISNSVGWWSFVCCCFFSTGVQLLGLRVIHNVFRLDMAVIMVWPMLNILLLPLWPCLETMPVNCWILPRLCYCLNVWHWYLDMMRARIRAHMYYMCGVFVLESAIVSMPMHWCQCCYFLYVCISFVASRFVSSLISCIPCHGGIQFTIRTNGSFARASAITVKSNNK